MTYGLHILGVLTGSQDFATHFLNEVLFQDSAHINDLSFLGDTQVTLGILSSYVVQSTFLFHTDNISFFLLFFLSGFNKKVM